MNSCDPFIDELDDFRDGSLPKARQQAVAAHLADCEACQKRVEQADHIESELRALAQTWQPSSGLWQRISESADSSTTGTRQSFRPVQWASAAVLVLCVAVSGLIWLQDSQDDRSNLVASVLVNEFHTFVVSHRDLDFSESEPREIRNWFGNKVDFRVPLPVRHPDMQLSGGRLCNMLKQRVASFMYQVDGAWVSLYIMRSAEASASSAASEVLVVNGYGFIDWHNQGLHYSLVGDLPPEQLRAVAEELRSTRILTRLGTDRETTRPSTDTSSEQSSGLQFI